MTQLNTDTLLTIGQAAKLLSIHINTVRRACNRNAIKSTRYGKIGWRRIALSDLERYAGRPLTLDFKDQSAVLAEREHFGTCPRGLCSECPDNGECVCSLCVHDCKLDNKVINGICPDFKPERKQ
jgi:excisionase family DNA binding protein